MIKKQVEAACALQHAVRAKIERAGGDPWDLPALVPVRRGMVSFCGTCLIKCVSTHTFRSDKVCHE